METRSALKTSAVVVAATLVLAHVLAHAADEPLVAFAQEGIYNSWRSANNDIFVGSEEERDQSDLGQRRQGSVAPSRAQVQNLLKLKPKVLIVEPAEQEAATPIAKLADEAGVPLIVADRGLSVPPGHGTFKIRNYHQLEAGWHGTRQVGGRVPREERQAGRQYR